MAWYEGLKMTKERPVLEPVTATDGMSISELIATLQTYQYVLGDDAEVVAQSHGCCPHGHDIIRVEEGQGNESGCVVIRV